MKPTELASKPPKILLYGPPGRGKTSLFMTLGEKAQLIDLDGNADVALGLNDNLRSKRLECDVKQFLEEDATKATAFRKVKEYIMGLGAQIKAGKFPYEIIGLDSLTSLAVGSQDFVMGNSGRLGQNPEIQHWGLLLTEIANIVKALKALPIPAIILAHEEVILGGEDKVEKVEIAIPGRKLPGQITRQFSEIWYMKIRPVGQGKQEISIQTLATHSITARSGRGLMTDRRIATLVPREKTTDSVSMWTLLSEIGWSPKGKEEDK